MESNEDIIGFLFSNNAFISEKKDFLKILLIFRVKLYSPYYLNDIVYSYNS